MDLDTADIDTQIAALQAARDRKLAQAAKEARRKEEEERQVLVGSTPSKERRVHVDPVPSAASASIPVVVSRSKPAAQILPDLPSSGPSRMSSSLALLRQAAIDTKQPSGQPIRSVGITSDPPSSTKDARPRLVSAPATNSKGEDRMSPEELEGDEAGVKRDVDSLEIIEKLALGPKQVGKDPEGEDVWAFLEPNSGIRMTKRSLDHSSVQDHFYGRYFLPPSLLYSVVRLSRDGATYDIPVEGDWLTIAVVAERGEIKVSGSKESISDDEDDEDGAPSNTSIRPTHAGSTGKGDTEKRPTKKAKFRSNKRGPRKYINLKLTALPPRSGKSSSAGHALLQLLLFEADAVIRSEPNEEGEVKRIYKGGSGGAYEKWCNLGVGSVIMILNPKVLRPLKAGAAKPHPMMLPLALNPINADAITLVGQARDLGCCSALQKDGNRCSNWVDVRQGPVCEYHIHAAMQRSRSARAEFTASTSSFSLTARTGNTFAGSKPCGFKIQNGYDSQHKTGLLPASGAHAAPRGAENGGGGATYVVGSGLVRTGMDDGPARLFGQEHVGEKLGRARAEKRKRRMEDKKAEEVMTRLVKTSGGKPSDSRPGEKDSQRSAIDFRRAFSADRIKHLGFDPHGLGLSENEARKAESLKVLKGSKRDFEGTRRVKRESVRAPPRSAPETRKEGTVGGKHIAEAEGVTDQPLSMDAVAEGMDDGMVELD